MVKNLLKDVAFLRWRGEALKHGYASVAAIPLIDRHQILGALAVYADVFDAFDPAEMHLLLQLARALTHGIAGLRTRAERGRAEEKLRKSEEHFRSLTENALDLIS